MYKIAGIVTALPFRSIFVDKMTGIKALLLCGMVAAAVAEYKGKLGVCSLLVSWNAISMVRYRELN